MIINYRTGIRNLLLPFVAAVILCAGCESTGQSAVSAADMSETVVYEEHFETAENGWYARGGSENVAFVSGAGIDGSGALFVSGRKKTWHSPIREMKEMAGGNSYRVSFNIKYTEGEASHAFVLSAQQRLDGKNEQYFNLGTERAAKGEWTRMEFEFDLQKGTGDFAPHLYVETPWKSDDAVTAKDLVSYYIDDFTVTRLPPAPPPAVEKDIPKLAEFFPFPFGVAVTYPELRKDNPSYDLLRHFDILVYGNEMKQDATQNSEGKFTFGRADELFSYAKKNKKRVRGHVLVWHSQVPNWFFMGSGPRGMATKEELYEHMENHIKTVAGRYKGRVDSWDVVNECIDEDGNYRPSKYYKIAGGNEYIKKAFQWAREADPQAKLILNDYNIEYAGAKQEGFYNLVKEMLEEGIPIDGIGLQMHIAVGHPSVNEIKNSIRRFAELGREYNKEKWYVQVTELDMSIYADGGEAKKKATTEILLDQAHKYRSLFNMFADEYKAGNLDMVMVWGLSDAGTWLDDHPTPGRADYPLFFGKDLKAKPAYWAIVDPARMPVYINKVDSIFMSEPVTGSGSPLWGFVTGREIQDAKGVVYGTFKTLWSKNKLCVTADIFDKTADSADAVTLYLDPENSRGDAPANVRTITVARKDGVQTDTGYRIFASFDFAGKLNKKAGFDLRITDGKTFRSFNDTDNTQDTTSVNYAVLTLKELPPYLYVKRGTPKIDGRIDSVWNTAAAVPLNVKTQGYVRDGSVFRVLWDDENVYVLFEVKDQLLNDANLNAYEQDSVEIFLDQNNRKTSVYEPDDAQYRVSFRNKVTFNGGDEETFRSKTRLTADGYIVEVACPLYAVKAAAGQLLGFDVQINEADATGARTGIRNWCNGTNKGYQDTSGFGLIILTE